MTSSNKAKSISDNQLYDLYIKQGLSRTEMSPILGLSIHAIKRLLKKRGIIKSLDQMKQERERKKIKTNLQKYSVTCVMKNPVIQEKAKQTNLKKYGVDSYSKTVEYQEKYRKTCLQKYGVEFHTQSLNTINNFKKTWNRKYVNNLEALKSITDKRRQTCLERYGIGNIAQLEETQNKIYSSMKNNHTTNSSKSEQQIFNQLVQKFGKEDIIYQTRINGDKKLFEKYPFNCDFYVKSLDLYIEYQGSWTHGKEPFNPNNPEHLKIIESWKEKAKKLNFRGNLKSQYSKAVNKWTISDPLKRETAKKNNLNFKEFFNLKEFEGWLDSLNCNKGKS